MSRSSGRSKVKRPKYTQEAADFDKFIKNDCFGDGSIREIKKCLEKLLRLFSVKEEIAARLPPGLHFHDVICYELQDLLASDKNKNRKWREFVLHTMLFHSCSVVKFKIMNINLESQFNEPIDELSISIEDYLTLVKSLRLQEHALHCLKQLKTEDKILLMKEFIKASMTSDLIANALSVDTPREIINFIIEHIKADIDIMLDEPILWSVLNFVEDILKHVADTSEVQSRDGRIPFITRYNKVDYRSQPIEYEVARDYLVSLVPRLVELLKYYAPDLLPLSDAIGTLLLSIKETIGKGRYSGLEDVINTLLNAFTERQNSKNSLRGRVGGHIVKMIDDSPYSLENKLLRLITESKSNNENTRKNALNSLLDNRFMNGAAWLNTIEENEKNYINELAVNLTKFIVSNYSTMTDKLQSQFRTAMINVLIGTSNIDHKESVVSIILNDAKHNDRGLITILGNDHEIKSKLESELVPLFNQLVPQSFEDKNLVASVYKYCAAIPSQFIAKIIDEVIKHKGQAELLLQMLQLAKSASKFVLPDGISLLVQEIAAKMNKSDVIQHQNHATNFINFISLMLTNQNNGVLEVNQLFHLLSNTIHLNMSNKNDVALVFDLKILAAFIEADPIKEWMNAPAVWNVLSDLTKLLDLHRNKYIGIRQLLPNEEAPLEGDNVAHSNKKSFNYNIIESVSHRLEYLTNNLKPKEELNQIIEQYLMKCEAITWSTRLTQLDLFESIKQHCASLSERVDRLNYPSETQQQQPQHPIEVTKCLVDMLLAAISSPVYSDLFVMLMEAKHSADVALAEDDDEDLHEAIPPNINLTSALSSGDITALDYLQPSLFPQYLLLASMHVIPYCTSKEILVLHELFVRLMENELLKFGSDLFREALGEEVKHEDIELDVLSLCFILRVIAVFDDEEASASMSYSIDFSHMIKTFVSLAEVRFTINFQIWQCCIDATQ
eukprot:TRINITY_DN2586_c0_g1_i1.p1 TRINITY_DN2586_c0_g1~~TRINITY_DN2586_c0_g1_i1.p1  ORF type:complete len:953 (-),score=184.38 TRINITY_DN2586_c0_g1_i1:234-3092(-)